MTEYLSIGMLNLKTTLTEKILKDAVYLSNENMKKM